MLEAVAEDLPEFFPYVTYSYSSSCTLTFSSFRVESAEGVQEGDPLGPLLFSTDLSKALSLSGAESTVAYLDDVVLGVKPLPCTCAKG